MGWKIYFWIYTALTIFAEYGSAAHGGLAKWRIDGWFRNFLLIPLAVVGLYAFSYKKKIFNPRVWQVTLVLMIFFDFYYYIYDSLLIRSGTPGVFIMIILIDLPLLFALYQLALKSHKNKSVSR